MTAADYESAPIQGADPGPTCYGNNGPLAITDCNVVLGKLRPEFFPSVFGADGKQLLNFEATTTAFQALAKRISTETGTPHTETSVAQGFLDVAADNMANAIKRSVSSAAMTSATTRWCALGEQVANTHAWWLTASE